MAIPSFVAGVALTAAELNTLAVPSAWVAPSFLNSWVNFGGGHLAAGYRLKGDVVELRGYIKTGTIATSAFTLPAGFRPSAHAGFAVWSNAGVGFLLVQSDGNVVPSAGSNVSFSINVSFSVTA